MKLHFENGPDYRKAAMHLIVSLFEGQEISQWAFDTVGQCDAGSGGT